MMKYGSLDILSILNTLSSSGASNGHHNTIPGGVSPPLPDINNANQLLLDKITDQKGSPSSSVNLFAQPLNKVFLECEILSAKNLVLYGPEHALTQNLSTSRDTTLSSLLIDEKDHNSLLLSKTSSFDTNPTTTSTHHYHQNLHNAQPETNDIISLNPLVLAHNQSQSTQPSQQQPQNVFLHTFVRASLDTFHYTTPMITTPSIQAPNGIVIPTTTTSRDNSTSVIGTGVSWASHNEQHRTKYEETRGIFQIEVVPSGAANSSSKLISPNGGKAAGGGG